MIARFGFIQLGDGVTATMAGFSGDFFGSQFGFGLVVFSDPMFVISFFDFSGFEKFV